MTTTTASCPRHPWQTLPCQSCMPHRAVVTPRRETPLGVLPALYVGEQTLATDPSAEAAKLRSQWVADRNDGVTPADVRPGDGNVHLWWSCGNTHHDPYQATLGQRGKGVECPECSGKPRAEFIWRVVKALSAGELSDIAALAILAKHGVIDPTATISGPVVKGLLAAVRDEGLTAAIDTDPEGVLDAVRTTHPPTVDEIRTRLGIPEIPVPPVDEPSATVTPEPKTEEQVTAELEALLDRAEAGGAALTDGSVVADLLGDDDDMIERLIREIEADLWEAAMLDPAVARARAETMQAGTGRRAEAAGNFIRLLNAAEALTVPGLKHTQPDGTFTELRLAQRRAVVTLAERGHVLNLMTVGGGKTLAAIAAGMKALVSNAMVVCPAPLVDQWAKEINRAYGSAAVEVHTSLTARSVDTRPDWWVLSVDTFSDPKNEAALAALSTEVRMDYLVVDEIHKAKQRGSSREGADPVVSARSLRLRTFRAALAQANPYLLVMGMTGTPTLNDLSEPISLLELTTGAQKAELGTEPTPGNVALVALEMRRHGIVTKPADDLRVHDPVRGEPATIDAMLEAADGFVPVDLSLHLGDLIAAVAAGQRSGLSIEQKVIAVKAEAFADFVVKALAEDRAIDPNAVIVAYSRHVDAVNDEHVVAAYRKALMDRGLSVRTFTAADRIPETQLSAATLGCDVVIGTQPMGTGVDGLQNHARRLVILSAPWTWAEHEQVVGRLARSGQRHEVEVNPVVGWFSLPSGRRLSLEAIDLLRVIRKKRLADAVLYGTLPSETLPDAGDVLTALQDWQTEVDTMIASLLDPALLDVPVSWWDIVLTIAPRLSPNNAAGLLSRWHAKWFHQTTGDRWANPDRERSVKAYGAALEKAREGWTHDPVNRIIERLQERVDGDRVIDAGCSAINPRIGIALAEVAKVVSYDMAAEHPLVQVADVTNLPERTGSANHFVLCQAIMATNAEAYLREAHRVLRWGGFLYIAEATKHFGENMDGFEAHLRSLGFTVLEHEELGQFTLVRAFKDNKAAPVATPWQWAHVG